MLRADFHIHTFYSVDSMNPLDKIIARCLEVGIDCIAGTDHNTIAGALEMERLAPFKVIVGEEILTASGEIIGYFLHEEIPARLTAEETVLRIKEQGGLVCIPHPFDRLRFSAIHRQAMEEILPYIDIIEVFNSRVIFARHCARAVLFAETHGLLASAGSDAHTIHEIGNAYVEMPEFDDRDGFCLALAQGRIVGRRSGIGVHLRSKWALVSKLLGS